MKALGLRPKPRRAKYLRKQMFFCYNVSMTNAAYQVIFIKENNEPLVDLAEFHFILEPSYFNQGFSRDNRVFLREGVAIKLEAIQKELKKYRFKIWDGFRSREVQHNIYQNFWNKLKKENPDWNSETLAQEVGVFVTDAQDPHRTPPHSTGGAVDLTLVDIEGKELDMGTVFDYFGPEAHTHYFDEVNNAIAGNRRLLREAMSAHGFAPYANEWWHFDYGNQLWALELNKSSAFYGETVIK